MPISRKTDPAAKGTVPQSPAYGVANTWLQLKIYVNERLDLSFAVYQDEKNLQEENDDFQILI